MDKKNKTFQKETNEKVAVVEEILKEPTAEKSLTLKEDDAFLIGQELHFKV